MRNCSVAFIATAVLIASATGAMAQGEPTSRPPIPSAGCGTSTLGQGSHRALTIEIDGAKRSWDMLVPEVHDGETPLPLWFGLHGRGLAPSKQISHAARVAEEQGFVVVAPQRDHSNGDHWMWDGDDTDVDLSRTNPDIALIDELIDHVGGELCIDLARVYATGFSSGGGGVTFLVCALEDRIAAAAAVAGLTFDLGDACELNRPVPFLAIHGTADSGPYFDGGFRIGHPIKELYGSASIPDRVAAIAGRNGCGPNPSIETLSDSAERRTWPCPSGAETELVVHSGGHNWYSHTDGRTTEELVWEFFKQHPLPE